VVSTDEVNLPTWRAEVRSKELQAVTLEVLFGRVLAELAVLEMKRLFHPAQPGFDACQEVHGLPEQDFFDCGPASFYNCRVPKTNELSAQVSRRCPVCGSDDAYPHLQKGELHLMRCSKCAMVYANPVPAQFASGEHYDQLGADYYLSPAKLESDYAEVRFERELRLFRKHCARGAVLDVGCSSGALLYQLNRRFPGCYDVLGTDVSGAPLDYAEARGVPVMRGNFTEQPFAEKKFDAVTFWAVLEHLLEPKRFIEKAWSILRPGGLCFVLVPNMKSLAARLLGARYRYIYPQHLNYFTTATLRRLVEARFSVIDVRSTHFNPIVIWQDWRTGGREVPNAERAALLKRTTSYKQNPMLRPVRGLYHLLEKALGAAGLADNLAAVLRKQ
jgi:2-polyprenyl-3-methyl-5-hydroxy-6-metoxy-1,4-benzoquinol methylase